MQSINLGPLAVPVAPLLLLGALFVSVFVAKWAGRGRQVDLEPSLWKILVAGVLAARIAFVALYFDSYRASPWRMLDIRDGGFVTAAGFVAAAAMTLWFAWRTREGRKPLLLAAFAGASFWIIGLLTMTVLHAEASPLPRLALTRLEGSTVQLESLKGKPVVVNLWATWCPPCRREMPVLRNAQQRHRDVVFVFANQGESPDAVRKYLESEGLDLDNVLLDPNLKLGRMTGSQALPTTLFFSSEGMLASRRIGELSTATLMQRIEALRDAGRQ